MYASASILWSGGKCVYTLGLSMRLHFVTQDVTGVEGQLGSRNHFCNTLETCRHA